jgi:hypothetical protein
MAPPCGCFGIGSNQIGPATVVLELSLLVLTAALLAAELRRGTNHGGTEETERVGREPQMNTDEHR